MRVSSSEFRLPEGAPNTEDAQVTAAMMQETQTQFAMLTDVGMVRTHNEDACAVDEIAGLYVVCDGMGGAAAGEVASQMAARVFLEQARQLGLVESTAWRLQRATKAANAAVFEEARHSPQYHGMGTTLVALELDRAAAVVWTVHVGDSRCYRLRGDSLETLTDDHSYVDEQVRMGLMTVAEAEQSPLRHVITRAVGSSADVEGDVAQHAARSGDVFLLCSDGLSGELNDADIARLLLAAGNDLEGASRALVSMANEHGGKDNVTVMLVRI